MADDPNNQRRSFFQEPGPGRNRVRQDSFSGEETVPVLTAVREAEAAEPEPIEPEPGPLLESADPIEIFDPQAWAEPETFSRPLPYQDPATARAKLALSPLSALLPRLGDITPLITARGAFLNRLRLLQAQAERRATEERIDSIAAEEAMINQTLQWLSLQAQGDEIEGDFDYSDGELIALYELGRLYYEVGYYGPGERIFSGLVAIDPSWGAARLGSGVVKLERGLFDESASHFRAALRDSRFQVEAKVGLSAVFLARGETERAASMLADFRREIEAESTRDELRLFWRALARRCSSDPNALT